SSLPSASSLGGAISDIAPRGYWLKRVARLLEHDQRVALVDRLTLLAEDLGHFAGVLGLDGHLHLHRLEDRDRVALLDLIADGALDFPHGAGDVGLNCSHSEPPDHRARRSSLTAG